MNTPNWKVYWSGGPGTGVYTTHGTREHALSAASDNYPLYRDSGDPLRIEGPNSEIITAREILAHCKKRYGQT